MIELSAARLAELMRARAVSPVEVVEAYLARIEDLNPGLNAIVTLAPDALERARQIEAEIMHGETARALHGVPVTVKDTFDVAGLRSTSGSRLRASRVPARDAAVVSRLRAAGAIILGKTNVPEMALTYDSENAVFGRTNNPYDYSRTPGGSSGGEAASIAASLSAAGLGSDLVGSIRIPSHFCGIFGLKPTAAAVSGFGHCPEMIGRLKQAASFGPLARSAQDLALMFDVLSDSAEASEFEERELRRARVAWYTYDGLTVVTEETARAVERAARALADAGFEVEETRPPGIERGPSLWSERFSPDVAAAMRAVYRTTQDEEKAGPAVRALLKRAASAYVKTEAERFLIDEEAARLRAALIEWMMERPFLLAPVGAVPAFEHGARKVYVAGHSMNVFDAFSYAQTFNTFDLPVISVPAGRTRDGLPIGVQLVGRPFSERSLLRVARFLEEALGGYQAPPDSPSTKSDNSL
jgi:amidase